MLSCNDDTGQWWPRITHSDLTELTKHAFTDKEPLKMMNIYIIYIYICLFPTCQVRFVRFYQSAIPPPHPPPPRPPPPPRLAVLFLLVLLLASSFSFSSTMSASTSTCTSALPTLRQTLCQLSSPSSVPTSQLSVHRWTSTWDLPSSVCTAGPQPGTVPAQCAPLDLYLRRYAS